jgi:hypothetical protein
MSKWTKEELDYVDDKFKKGLTAEEISKEGKKDKILDRSPLSVEYKTYPAVCEMLEKGKSYEEVAKKYNRSVKDIKSIEKKYNEIKKDKFTSDKFTSDKSTNDKSTNDKPSYEKFQNNDTQKTMYTNVGGYVLNNDNSFDLNQFHDINRKMDAFLKFYENISRLNKLKSEKIIEEKLYSNIFNKLNMFNFDKDAFVNSLCEPNAILKSSLDNDIQEIKQKSKDNKDSTELKKTYDSDSDDVEIEIPVKKFTKRLI